MATVKPSAAPLPVLYRSAGPPPVVWVRKPMRPGGCSDSRADLAFNLARAGVLVVTPVCVSWPEAVFDRGSLDTEAGLQAARGIGGGYPELPFNRWGQAWAPGRRSA